MPADDIEVEMVYDPDQDQEVARDLRKQYLHTTKQFEDNKDMSTKDAAAALDKADILFEEVRAIKEATHDSALLVHISKFGAARARAMKSGSGAFDVDDFVARLITYMGGRKPTGDIDDDDDDDDASEHDAAGAPLDWERIARRALAKSKRSPVMDFMYVYQRSRPLRSPSVLGASYFGLRAAVVCALENVWALDGLLGPLSIEQKKRKIGKRARLEKNKEDMRKPQEIREEDITRSGNETTKNVAALERILVDHGQAVNIFRLIINPHDFPQSVENLFYLSFLIRDGLCAFQVDKETGEPTIMLCQEPTHEEYVLGGLVKHQMVMEFDMDTWKRAIEVFGITEPMIPQRAKSKTRIGSKWYG
ncbi:hypothetical protein K466DRAFT_632466 [Polyporus arcularius HHB13444]|uniref:Non-structural maintenance of chromosomes element 4 n=1 Tax=Polyporus arcularius HHB13444 TaxID=1314778 RepID=A0A5C3PXC5_9APHY|nr:hypothetical protein K466DRAFT_632466 [Polyporus arcularius HHB13444]